MFVGNSSSKKRSNLRHKKYDVGGSESDLSINSAEQTISRNQRAAQLREQLVCKREEITMLKHPLTTLFHFTHVLSSYYHYTLSQSRQHSKPLYSFTLFALAFVLLCKVPGVHSPFVRPLSESLQFISWWIMLGILSSIGLGTGLHTFVLYTGPFIAKTTIAAGECNSVAFHISGDKAFICPTSPESGSELEVYHIFLKVQFAAFLWGIGTAIGEMPPYFVSRAALRAGNKLHELDQTPKVRRASFADKVKSFMVSFLDRFGFWAIVLFASIPNPLFDLAGLTCGHFGVEFWTFFTATFIGKAVVKAHLQALLVVIMFHKKNLELFVQFLDDIILPESWAQSLHRSLKAQKQSFHQNHSNGSMSFYQIIWQCFLILMIIAFLVSIVDSVVQERLAQLDEIKISQIIAQEYESLSHDNQKPCPEPSSSLPTKECK